MTLGSSDLHFECPQISSTISRVCSAMFQSMLVLVKVLSSSTSMAIDLFSFLGSILTDTRPVIWLLFLSNDWPLRCVFWLVGSPSTYWTWLRLRYRQFIKSSGPPLQSSTHAHLLPSISTRRSVLVVSERLLSKHAVALRTHSVAALVQSTVYSFESPRAPSQR